MLAPLGRAGRRLARNQAVIRLLLVGAVMFCAVRIVSPVVFRLESGELSVRMVPAIPGGDVVLHLGPFGDLSWDTHKGPVNVDATFRLGRQVRELPDPSELRDLRVSFLLRRMYWLALAGAAAGALVVEVAGHHRLRAAAGGAAIALGAGALLVGVSVFTFDARAFGNPRYRGPIGGAPRIIELLKEARRDLAGVERNINEAVAGLQRIHEQIVAGAPPAPAEATRLLVISDLHNNPLGLLIAQEMTRQFGVDGILNAGDFTDRGSAPEAELFARFADLGLPHAIAPGNHEDRAAIDRVRRVPGITVLLGDEDVADVAGIRVLGDADPSAVSISSDPTTEESRAAIALLCERLRARLVAADPDVVLVHDPAAGECAAEQARLQRRPLVFVWGHTHRSAYEERDGVVGVSPGTSGSNGLKSAVEAAYGFALLEFDPEGGTLRSTCLFEFEAPGILRSASCHLGDATPAPLPSPS